jgi:hypothetical protein
MVSVAKRIKSSNVQAAKSHFRGSCARRGQPIGVDAEDQCMFWKPRKYESKSPGLSGVVGTQSAIMRVYFKVDL